jgi:hypothetical protein
MISLFSRGADPTPGRKEVERSSLLDFEINFNLIGDAATEIQIDCCTRTRISRRISARRARAMTLL